MTIDILICTLNEGIQRVPSVLLPPIEGVRYVVCMQYTDETALDLVPMKMMISKDVKLYIHEGKGLCRNRNFALDWAEADICLIADDDNRYKPEYIEHIRKAYESKPEADIITFKAETPEGQPLHKYPADFVCSVEMTFRTSSIKKAGLTFNEDFGIGGNKYCAGEEDIFIHDARTKGLHVEFVPQTIVQTPALTTGSHFATSPLFQKTKGAVFAYRFGKTNALYRTMKEAAWWLLHKGANPIPIIFNMIKGIYAK